MKRTPLRRSSKPIPKRRTKPRRGPLRCPEYRRWLRNTAWCAVGEAQGSEACSERGISDPAHTENNGASSKGPDSSCAPLCRRHHIEYDAGRKAFERKYGLHMRAIAKVYWSTFQTEQAAARLAKTVRLLRSLKKDIE